MIRLITTILLLLVIQQTSSYLDPNCQWFSENDESGVLIPTGLCNEYYIYPESNVSSYIYQCIMPYPGEYQVVLEWFPNNAHCTGTNLSTVLDVSSINCSPYTCSHSKIKQFQNDDTCSTNDINSFIEYSFVTYSCWSPKGITSSSFHCSSSSLSVDMYHNNECDHENSTNVTKLNEGCKENDIFYRTFPFYNIPSNNYTYYEVVTCENDDESWKYWYYIVGGVICCVCIIGACKSSKSSKHSDRLVINDGGDGGGYGASKQHGRRCSNCNGSGQISVPLGEYNGAGARIETCRDCHGSGFV